MPGFPDKMAPFYKAPPGSALSGGFSQAYGAGIRRLRRMTMRADNFEPLWDKTGEVPTAWAREQREPTTASKVMGFFYKKLQYSGTVDQRRRYRDQPVPKSLDILQHEPGERLGRYTGADPHAEEGAGREES
jgi:hypothetical protein